MNEWKLYATVSQASSVTKTENGYERDLTVHISSARTLNRENIEINSPEDFQQILADNPRTNHVMYYFGWCPRRGTSIEKSAVWIKKLLKTKSEINKKRSEENK